MRAKRLLNLFLIVAIATLGTIPQRLVAQTNSPTSETSTIPMLPSTTRQIGFGHGNQTDPHVVCNGATYVNDNRQGSSSISYYNFALDTEFTIPGTGKDAWPDTDGRQIAFTALGPRADNRVLIYDLQNHTTTVVPGTENSRPVIANNVVAFLHGNAVNASEIEVFDVATQTTTQLSSDGLFNREPSISPDGKVIVWEKCESNGLGCDIYSATRSAGSTFTIRRLTAEGEDRFADTNGQVFAYLSDKGGEVDVYVQRLDGTKEVHIAVPGNQRRVRLSGSLVEFESENGLAYDIFLYDLSTSRLYQVTNKAWEERFSDVSAECDGLHRIVYVVNDVYGDFDTWAQEFELPDSIPDQLNNVVHLVESFNLHDGMGNSLLSKLQDALTAINNIDSGTACDSLTAFINASQAQAGKKLTTSQSTQLIEAATAIKSNLGCQ